MQPDVHHALLAIMWSVMNIRTGRPFAYRLPSHLLQFVAAVCVLFPHALVAQGLTGSLIGAVKDEQGGALRGAVVRVSSPALIGGTESMISDERGQLRFPILPP